MNQRAIACTIALVGTRHRLQPKTCSRERGVTRWRQEGNPAAGMSGARCGPAYALAPGGEVPARIAAPSLIRVRDLPAIRGVIVLILLLGVVLGSCASSEADPRDTRPGPEPCDVQPVSIKAGAQWEPILDRTTPAGRPTLPDTTVVWHCGPPPDTRPTVIAVHAPSLSAHGPRSPPRG
jgi:hypothetical protein